MTRAFSIFVLLAALSADASLVRLAWDASPTPGCSNVVYAHTNAIALTNYYESIVRLNVGTNTTLTATDFKAGQWHFAVVAVLDGVESDLSNVLPLRVPEPVGQIFTVIPQWSASVTSTNWQDIGFFKVRIER